MSIDFVKIKNYSFSRSIQYNFCIFVPKFLKKKNLKDMKKYIFFFFLLIGFNQLISAQVKIGDVTTKADPSSVLELQSTDRGLLISRLTTAQVNAILNPATGLLVYNTDLSALQVNVGTPASAQWVSVVVYQGTSGSGAMMVSVGTTAQRPATPKAGMIRFNTDTNTFEGYNGTSWITL